MTDLPEPMRAVLTELVATRFSSRESAPEVAAALPEGAVVRLAGGGPFGWGLDARLDRVDGRLALEVLEDSRMAGPEHYRLWEDGTKEALENERSTFVFPAGASEEERERIQQEGYLHNRRVQQALRARGFMGG